VILLGPILGREKAHDIVEKATRRSTETGRPLREVLAEIPVVALALTREQIEDLDAAHYLGSAEIFRKQLLETNE